MDQESNNVTTITILDVSLSLVHIPRSRVPELNRPILKQLLRKAPKFLNLTANEIELSIFAEVDELADFEPVARKDRHRQRFRDSAAGTPGHRRRRRSHSSDPVEISLENWRVLQIDSHDDSLDKSGSRVRELTSPLAAAGISILYQSSYLSDFIFVKSARLPEVIKILGAEGFSLYNANPFELFISPLTVSGHGGLLAHPAHEANVYELSHPGTPGTTGTMSPAVFSRTRSPSTVSLTDAMSKPGTAEEITSTLLMHRTKACDATMSSCATSRASGTPKKSLSPAAAPVKVLAPDLACVGLSESAVDVWSVKIITLVGYPELIPTPFSEPIPPSLVSHGHGERRRNSLVESLYGSVPDGTRRTISSPATGPLSPTAVFSSVPEDSDAGKDSDRATVSSSRPRSSSSSSFPSSDGGEYFSSSSPYNRTRPGSDSAPSPVSTSSQSSSRSLPERLEKSKGPHLHKTKRAGSLERFEEGRLSPSYDNINYAGTCIPPVPFFSFTRTVEGSSLTTDIRVLSALFRPDERHMVICSGTLLDAGDELIARAVAEQELGVNDSREPFDVTFGELRGEVASGPMKCLQIDLQRFGLDKHGLVSRFSRILDESGINHMYSSTYKTANLLVNKGNAGRAQALLRSC